MSHRVCPWWLGWFLISPVRRFAHDPGRIVGPFLRPGMLAVDFGCGMGHFSLPMARMVGRSGRVVCVDVQEKMLAGLRRRAAKAGLADRMDLRGVTMGETGLSDLSGRADFILLMFVVHEVPDPGRLFRDLAAALAPGGRLLLAEPVFHVREKAFTETVAAAEKAGLTVLNRLAIRRARAALLGLAAARGRSET